MGNAGPAAILEPETWVGRTGSFPRATGGPAFSRLGDGRRMLDWTNLVVIVSAALVVVAVLTSLISFRIGAPLLLVFLVVGLVAGEDGPIGIDFDNVRAAYLIGSIALAVILFDSGFETRRQTFRIAAGPAIALSTLGVVLTTAVVGTVTMLMLHMSFIEGLLMGAIVSSTDAAAVFFLLRVGGINIRDRVRSTLEVESGSNDPVAILLTLTLVELIAHHAGLGEVASEVALHFVRDVAIGLAAGVAAGFGIVFVVNRIELDPALYPIIVLALALFFFALTGFAGGSGFLAVYVAGLIAGNARVRHTLSLKRFQRGMTWLAQIAMFLTLGLLATPSEFPRVLIPALVIGGALILVGRPLAVWLSLIPFHFSRYETAFVSWVGLRGAVSILLAIVPIIGGLPNGQTYFNVAFLVVLMSLLIQGWTIGPVARFLHLIVPGRAGPVDRVELELPGRADHEVVTYRVHPESAVGRGARVPRWARPALIFRDGISLRPHTAGRLRPGDQVYIVAASEHVALLDDLFARRPDEARDSVLYGDFLIAPDAPMGDLAVAYGFPLPAGEEALSAREFIQRALGQDIEPGDRVPLGEVELVVRSIGEDRRIDEIGLAIEPGVPARPRLPLFQSRGDIVEAWRRWRQKRLARVPAAHGRRPAARLRRMAALPSAPEPRVEGTNAGALPVIKDEAPPPPVDPGAADRRPGVSGEQLPGARFQGARPESPHAGPAVPGLAD